jgi:hypothetical protein
MECGVGRCEGYRVGSRKKVANQTVIYVFRWGVELSG